MNMSIQRALLMFGVSLLGLPAFAAAPSVEEFVQLALSAAPPSISNDATVLAPGKDGKLVDPKEVVGH
jgi:hypothetical protein